MSQFSPLIRKLVESLTILPGVGPKSAQRMAMHLLERDRKGAARLLADLQAALEKVGHCESCRNLTEQPVCSICTDEKRSGKQICVVENPADVHAIEQTNSYHGHYFVLFGRLSPIDGIGPAELGLELLRKAVADKTCEEIILATNPTVEGEATAQFIRQMFAKQTITISRIAHGVPLGGELEFVDGGTLAHAFAGRKQVN
jgi:recombination protein RecR